MRESVVENKVRLFAKSKGWLSYKWKSANRRGVPDRLFFKNGRLIIIEFKAPGEVPTKKQEKVKSEAKRS